MESNVIKTTEQKVFTYYKRIKTVSVSSKYDSNPTTTHTIAVLKRGTRLTALNRKTMLQKVNFCQKMSSLQNKKM